MLRIKRIKDLEANLKNDQGKNWFWLILLLAGRLGGLPHLPELPEISEISGNFCPSLPEFAGNLFKMT